MSIRMSTEISLKERQVLQFGDFKGVDFSSSPLRVAVNRATDMKNFINEYGVNRKRNGWNELIRIKDGQGNDLKINGIFNYQNGSTKKTIVHAGKKFFTLDYNAITGEYSVTDITNSSTYADAAVVAANIEDKRSQCVISKGRLYIIGCGDFLVYGTWNNGTSYELRRVYNNSDTYIPTTTISIDDDSVEDDTNRATLDDINLLTNKRINQLLGVDSANKTYTLDSGEIDANTTVAITLETLNGTTPITKTITNSGVDKTILYDTSNTQVGTISFATGQITFSINTKPQIADRDNIFVTFQHTNSNYTDRIRKCNFGILFGTNGSSNRLFLSGNEDMPNYDFYSEVEDFTYFSDINYAVMGSSAYSIKAYSRLSDSTLAIFKEDNSQEATVYFRTGKDTDYYDTYGNLIKTTTIFPTTAGSIGEGIKSRYACANLSGDVLILSPNGLFGIILGENVSTQERYAKERSRYINERLKQHTDLSEAVGIVYKNRYFLSVEGVCYVADARFTSSQEGDMGDTFNYEWWFWDNIPARVWAIMDDKLYFGTATGQICVFDNEYCDRSYYNTTTGQLSLSIVNNNFTYGGLGVELKENDRIKFATSGLYEIVLNNISNSDDIPYTRGVSNNKITIDAADIGLFYNGMEVYADNVGSSGLVVNTKYTISDLDYEECSFKLKKTDNTYATISTTGFRLSRSITGKELFISDLTTTSFKVKYLTGSKAIKLVSYNNTTPATITASIILRRNVVAEWYSPVLDFGTNQYSKTLLSLTISTDPSTNGHLQFGYETKNIDKLHQARGMRTFSFDDLDFNNFSFESAFANSYTKKVLVRNFNYIMFKFKSDNDTNCIINNLTVVYKINKINKGVK